MNDGGVPTEDSAPACTSSISDELLAVDVLSESWFATAFGEGHAAIGYADAASVPTLVFASRADGAVKQIAVSKAIDARKYGTRMVALTHAHDRFAMAFTTERTSSDGSTTGLQAIAFATIDPSTDTVSPAVYANVEMDRTSSSKGYVTARYPSVHPTADGFLVAWEDFRTKEPVVTGVNLFGWTGIYATPFSAQGKALATDGQIAQPTGMIQAQQGIVSLPANGQLVGWLARKDENIVLHTRVGPSSGKFSPWTPDAPELDLGMARGRALSLTRGGDGKHLAAVVSGDEFTSNLAFLLLLDEAGAPIGDRVKLEGDRFGAIRVVASGERYYVVIEQLARATYPGEDTLAGFRVIELSADGKVVADREEPIALEKVVAPAPPQVVVTDSHVEIMIATRPARADRYKPAKLERVSAHIVSACR